MSEFGDLIPMSAELIAFCAERRLKVATAESCTGGLVAAMLTEVSGSSAVVDRGLVSYSDQAKIEMLGVDPVLLAPGGPGAVSPEVAIAMVEGAIARSNAHLAVAVTGIAGPDGGSAEKPVGLVHFAAMRRGGGPLHAEHRFGAIGRSAVRLATVRVALEMLKDAAT